MCNPANEILKHILDCDKCPREGSIVNPNKDKYCDVGYDLLLKYISYNEKVKHVLNTIDLLETYKK